MLGLYRTSGPEFYWNEARAAMLTKRDKAPFGTAHAQMSAPLDGLEGGGREGDVRVRVASSSRPGRNSPVPSPARRRRSTSVRCAAGV